MLFTPRDAKTGMRYKFRIKRQNIPRGYRWQRHIEVKGKKYLVKGASCGSKNCFCDAIIYGYIEVV